MKQRTGKAPTAAAALWPARRNAFACATLFIYALTVPPAVAAPQPPSEDELRSMYCVEVIRGQIELQRHLIAASDAAAISATTPELRQQWIDTSSELLQGLGKLEVARYRLQAYMLPRIPALDSFALAAAMRRGYADFQDTRGGIANQQPPVCSAACGDVAPLSRVSACENPTWLAP